MSTEETAALTAPEIRRRFDAIAPYPDRNAPDHARQLACYLAVRAQRRWKRNLDTEQPNSPGYHESAAAMMAEFAALHLLVGVLRPQPGLAAILAREITEAWDDGGRVGEWLWELEQFLGIDSAEVDRLEAAWQALAPAQPSVTGYGPSADALRLEHERDEARAVVRELAAKWRRRVADDVPREEWYRTVMRECAEELEDALSRQEERQ